LAVSSAGNSGVEIHKSSYSGFNSGLLRQHVSATSDGR
jgi:hypothetical protein